MDISYKSGEPSLHIAPTPGPVSIKLRQMPTQRFNNAWQSGEVAKLGGIVCIPTPPRQLATNKTDGREMLPRQVGTMEGLKWSKNAVCGIPTNIGWLLDKKV